MKGEVMRFDDRPEAIWLYKNCHKYHHIVIQKCSQIGMTEFLFNLMMYWLQNNIRVLFLVPNDTWRTDYVRDRVDGNLIRNCPFYKENYGSNKEEAKNVGLKTFFGTKVKFAGVRNKSNLFSYPCKAIIVDEFDLCNQSNLVFAEDRVGWKTTADEEDPYTIKIGNPSIENWGLNKEFKKVDQYFWYAQCDHCKHEQIMDWKLHFVEKIDNKWRLKDPQGNPICLNCKKPFNRRGNGQYKLTVKGYKPDSIGIHADKLRWDVDKDGIQKLFVKWLEAQNSITAMENFYNQNLGLPYAGSEHRITKQMLYDCAANGPTEPFDVNKLEASTYIDNEGKTHIAAANKLFSIVAGVDQGQDKGSHMHISIVEKGVRTKIFIGRVNSLDELDEKLKYYKVGTCVIDSQGGAFGYTDLQQYVKNAPCQVLLCRYRPKDKIETLYTIDYENKVIQVNRTGSLDASFDAYKNKEIILPFDLTSVDNNSFVPEMTESVRKQEINPKTSVVETTWIHSSPDDHRHADNYELLAMLIAGLSPACENSFIDDEPRLFQDKTDDDRWAV
jgi:hypothetical protein